MDTRDSDWFGPVETPRGWVYALRPGDRGSVVAFALVLAFPVVGLFGGAVLMLGFLVSVIPTFGWHSVADIFVLLPLMSLAVGSVLLIVVLQRWIGRDELRLDAGAIRVVRRLGPVSWWKTIRRSKVAQLTVVNTDWFGTDDSGRYLRREYHILVAEDERGRRRNLVRSYPRDLLLALAVDLTTRWKTLSIDPELTGVGPKKLTVGEESDSPTDIRERTYAPRGTRLLFERQGEHGVRITVPPVGFLSTGPLGCSLIGVFCLLTAAYFAAPLILTMQGDKDTGWSLVGLVLIGIVALVGSVHGAISQCVLIATPDSLTQEWTGLRGTVRKTWRRAAIRSIRVEAKVIDDGEGGVTHLTRVLVHTTSPIKTEPDELQLDLPKPELEWIATTLRGMLGVPASEAPTDAELRTGLGLIDPP